MAGKGNVKCAKCGIAPRDDPSLTFHRFPLPSKQGSLRVQVWAKFCYPNDDWTSNESLQKLYAQHKMICGKHFDDSSFTSSDRKRLNKFAVPTEARSILTQLRDQQCNSPREAQETKNPMSTVKIQMEVTPSTSQYSKSIEESNTKQPKSTVEIGVTASTSKDIVFFDDSNIHSRCHPESPVLTKESRKKGILMDLDVKKMNELTPKKQKLYARCRRNMTEILRLRRKFKKVKKCKRSLLSALTCEDSVNDMLKTKISSSFCLLLQSQLKNVPRKITGRRWTLDDKVLALGIYKKSNACYRLLRRLFCLPSVSSLKALLNKIPMICGINNQVIKTIKNITDKRELSENLCVLAFDEMSIRKNLTYNAKLDQIDGYQDHALHGRTSQIASHALTFMAIGLRKHWKQPIAFYFSGDCVTADRLAVLIKEVLRACLNTGLEVVGTVCDLDGVNIRAINSLGSSTDRPYFNFEGHEIVTILDPPHLLKCFRNNFLKHNIEFAQDVQIEGKRQQGLAKWNHIEEFYKQDQTNPNFVYAPALTQQHLQPNGKQKMKVRLAAQVLSHSVAAGIFAKVAMNELPQDAIATATIIANLDKLFDAMNGDTPDRKRGKEFLTNMSSTSPHLMFFKKMKSFFKDMKFLGARSKPPSQEGWLRTLNAIERIFNNLNKYNIRTLSVRRLNQDPLENCFGCIRSNCGCNPNPTSVQFIAALKTGIVTNLLYNNKNRNCLDDNNDLLNNFKVFLKPESVADVCPSTSSLVINIEGVEDIDISQCSSEMQACAYVCGFILKNMKINCTTCKSIMLADQNTEICHSFTAFKEYHDKRSSLNYVQYSFCETVESAAHIINNYLKENAHNENVKLNLYKACENLNTDWLKRCEDHYSINVKQIISSTIAICLKRFCKLKNQEFVEEASKKALKRKINILHHV